MNSSLVASVSSRHGATIVLVRLSGVYLINFVLSYSLLRERVDVMMRFFAVFLRGTISSSTVTTVQILPL